MKAVHVIKPKEKVEERKLVDPKPRGKQVVVEINSAGVCHSDIHIWEGGYDRAKAQIKSMLEKGVKFPLTLGHEIAGTFEAVRSDVAGIKKGQNVVVYP